MSSTFFISLTNLSSNLSFKKNHARFSLVVGKCQLSVGGGLPGQLHIHIHSLHLYIYIVYIYCPESQYMALHNCPDRTFHEQFCQDIPVQGFSIYLSSIFYCSL